ncbi:hypothetical protein ACWDMR_29155 [Streptomyces althioticus]|jgi:hypothetical protein|uniref:Uncharacterized protein n=2 Tax=Streptomyces althioticus group TaxID=2867194 RepID=A0ABU3I5B6_9ACTN|nr:MULTISPECIES: hypothetical protein [Actinomycetes]ALV48681.1 hypothetical protein ASR50_04290 [Streptomyces sp. 4F]MCC9684535.1 hypothetical protein [Streptomyces sp. MNU103]MDT3728148.1 hypothetical protein [Streptomyces sp. DSM 41972]SCE08986.1 hypothetical protein GA0115238_145911 [Streptomyces sp. di50b]SCE23153.1 hypothetical protein GA0115245_126812 [Streptomyces sp. di188]GGQ64423.1 hypothetical protein GCM10010250_40750 [Streptomyces althioticus]GGT42549.1 hypothetical protein GCM
MSESEFTPEDRPVDVYLDLLRVRMDTEDYRLLLRLVEPVLEAIDEHRLSGLDLALDGGDEELPQEVRDEAALVIATAVTGRLDNEVVELDVDDDGGPVRVVTDAETAADPSRLGEIAGIIRDRHRQNEELRGIAEASGLPTDF